MTTSRTIENGLKKWLVGLVTALLLSWSGWVSAHVIESIRRTSTMEDHINGVDHRLESIEKKLDVLISR